MIKNIQRFPKRKGRNIIVNGVAWKWTCSRQGSVLAYSEKGDRLLGKAWKIKGLGSSDAFDRGQYKKTSDGALYPNEVEKWIKANAIYENCF
jgi:hypothetical protein